MSFALGLILGIALVPFLNKFLKYDESETYRVLYSKGESFREIAKNFIETISLKYNNSGENNEICNNKRKRY